MVEAGTTWLGPFNLSQPTHARLLIPSYLACSFGFPRATASAVCRSQPLPACDMMAGIETGQPSRSGAATSCLQGALVAWTITITINKKKKH